MSTPKERRHIEKYLDVRDKVAGVNYYADTMLNKTLTMFKYKNLPDTLPERELELLLQTVGKCIVTEWNGDLIALDGNYAPPNDAYYRPTHFIVANPWAMINEEFRLVNCDVQSNSGVSTEKPDAVLLRNDPLDRGLLPIIHRYGALLTETDLTLYLADINFRSIYNIVANTDREYESAKLYLQQIEEGRQGVMMEEDLSNGIKTNPYSNSSQGYITQLIELEQYLRGTFLNEVGLNANYNMKRERLSANETELNEDSLRPLIDVMLEERQLAVDWINKIYGTDISVEFGSAWSKYNDNPMPEEDEAIELTEEEEVTDDGRADDGDDAEISDGGDAVADDDVEEVDAVDDDAVQEDGVADSDVDDSSVSETESESDAADNDDPEDITVVIEGDNNKVDITVEDGTIEEEEAPEDKPDEETSEEEKDEEEVDEDEG